MKTAVSVILLVSIAVFGVLRLWEFISGIHPAWAVALNETCVGLILAAAAWWPLATGRRMRMLFGFYTMPSSLQIAFQILLMAGAGWCWVVMVASSRRCCGAKITHHWTERSD